MSKIIIPPALDRIALRHLCTIEVDVGGLQQIGTIGDSLRRVGPIVGGRFDGERLRGHVLSGGADWQTVASDGTTALDARMVLETDAGDLIGMTFGGIRHGPADVLARLARGEPVDPAEYYFRISATFSAGSPSLGWLNRIVAVGNGHRLPQGPIYNLFEVA